jgi:hypothetical protein
MKEFDKNTKPREIFVHTCKRIAEPLAELGFKYRKSKNDIVASRGEFSFIIHFQPRGYGFTYFFVHVIVESGHLAAWRKREYQNDKEDGTVFSSTLAMLTQKEKEWPDYDVSTPFERERVIAEIEGQIREFAIPFFARFDDLPQLVKDVKEAGFLPHRKVSRNIFDRDRIADFLKCFADAGQPTRSDI